MYTSFRQQKTTWKVKTLTHQDTLHTLPLKTMMLPTNQAIGLTIAETENGM